MRSAALIAALVGCGEPSNSFRDAAVDTLSPSCAEAVSHSDFAWLETNIFVVSCVFSTCHNGADTGVASKIDLRAGQAYTHLVGAVSDLEPTRMLVVAGAPARSYLLVMLGQIQPQDADPPANPIRSDIGTMPQGNSGQLLCVEKRDAIERWIAAGAAN
jgi:hypothetical protein